jgi:hypothetical protein
MGCGGPAFEELERHTSPDGRVDAVLVRSNGGATTSFGYSVHIVPTSTVVDQGTGLVFACDHQEGLSVSWIRPKLLLLEYQQARIFQFTNFWQSRAVDDWSYVVEIREQPLTDPPSLSSSDRWESIHARPE